MQDVAKFSIIKIDTANNPPYFNNLGLQLLRVLKYVHKHTSLANPVSRKEVSLSLPYYSSDAVENKALVEPITNMKMGLLDAFRIVLLFPLLVVSDLNVKKNKSHVVGVISIAMIYYYCLRRQGASVVRFHRYAFVPEVATFLYILSENDGIECHFYESGSFVNENLVIRANVLHHNNEISSNYAQEHADLYRADIYRYDISLADLSKKFINDTENSETIGVYSSGMYCRRGRDAFNRKIISDGVFRESKLFSLIYDYALRRPDIAITIFPHYARGIETYELALVQYKKLLALGNVELSDPEVESIELHSAIGLGITIISYVFWDRLFVGRKTVLFDPYHIDHFVRNTALQNIVLSSDEKAFSDQLDNYIGISNKDFFDLIDIASSHT